MKLFKVANPASSEIYIVASDIIIASQAIKEPSRVEVISNDVLVVTEKGGEE